MPKNITNLTIKNLDTVDDMMLAFPLVRQMYKDMNPISYRVSIEEMICANNFRMIGVFFGDKLIGVCGYWVLLMLYCGRYIQASNLVVDENYRNLGIGKKILDHLEKLGRQMDCVRFVLDSYSENKKSHPLYFREGFYIRGFHFMKDL